MDNLASLIERLKSLHAQAVAGEDVRDKVFGQNGLLNQATEIARSIPQELRKNAFNTIQDLKKLFLEVYNQKKVDTNLVDVTVSTCPSIGKLHPIPSIIAQMKYIMTQNGFIEKDGPCIEDEEHNFDALNVHEMHPARGMHDTFYLPNSYLLRTHTSGVQIRTLESGLQPPFGIFHAGKVYRRDDDTTHSPMFHQMEGLYVGDVHFGHLKHFIKTFLVQLFEDPNLKLRFRPSYFPFTEPSVEVDLYRSGSWLEVLGGGMVRRNILDRYGYKNVTGFAFGMGVERQAMIKFGISNIHEFYKNRFCFLDSFGIDPGAHI